MIQRIVVLMVIITVIWSIILRFLPSEINTSQGQRNSNMIKAEAYLYEQSDVNSCSIIVGSSLSARLPDSAFSANTINLAFGGQSPHDGLLLVSSKVNYPKQVYIEINTILKEGSADFQNELYSPIKSKLQSVFPIFLTRNQPLAVFKGLIRKKTIKKVREVNEQSHNENAVTISPDIFNQTKKQYNQLPSDNLIDKRLSDIEKFVHFLESKNARIIFFELPVHPSLCASPLACLIRTELHKRFPLEKYKYIQQPPCAEFMTTDGIHLTGPSADKYIAYFKKHAE